MTLEIPYLTYSDIGKTAQEFLSQYHPSLELPIPIETIIDVKMGLNIVTFPSTLSRSHDGGGDDKDYSEADHNTIREEA